MRYAIQAAVMAALLGCEQGQESSSAAEEPFEYSLGPLGLGCQEGEVVAGTSGGGNSPVTWLQPEDQLVAVRGSRAGFMLVLHFCWCGQPPDGLTGPERANISVTLRDSAGEKLGQGLYKRRPVGVSGWQGWTETGHVFIPLDPRWGTGQMPPGPVTLSAEITEYGTGALLGEAVVTGEAVRTEGR